MSRRTELEMRFSKLGGVFLTPIRAHQAAPATIRGLVCDWDGVFNGGAKGEGARAPSREPDSMGTNCCATLCGARTARLPVAA